MFEIIKRLFSSIFVIYGVPVHFLKSQDGLFCSSLIPIFTTSTSTSSNSATNSSFIFFVSHYQDRISFDTIVHAADEICRKRLHADFKLKVRTIYLVCIHM